MLGFSIYLLGVWIIIVKQDNFKGNPNNLEENNISIGKELSFDLNLKIGDKIMIMSSAGIQTIIGNLPKQKTFIINSIFDSGLADFDRNIGLSLSYRRFLLSVTILSIYQSNSEFISPQKQLYQNQ